MARDLARHPSFAHDAFRSSAARDFPCKAADGALTQYLSDPAGVDQGYSPTESALTPFQAEPIQFWLSFPETMAHSIQGFADSG